MAGGREGSLIRPRVTPTLVPMLALVASSFAPSRPGTDGTVPSGGSAEPAEVDPVVVSTDRLALTLDPVRGTIELAVDGAARPVPVPGITLDGAPQTDFEVVGGDALPVLSNGILEVSFEVLDERAIAVTWSATDGRRHDFELHLRSDDQTAYYGTGERFNALDQRGYVLPMVTDDRYGNKGVGSYKPVPFFMSTQGFGVWVDSFAPSVFDLSGTERFGTRLEVPETALRVVFFGGPSMADILESYTGLTGRPPIPPAWAFGLWKSRDVHHNADSVLADVERLRRHRIPASVLVIDSPWETGYNDFRMNRRQFEDPPAMLARVEDLGFRLCLWLTPFVNVENVRDLTGIDRVTATFDEASVAGHLVADSSGEVALSEWWKGVGGMVDFTDPAARAWWREQLGKTRAYGARAFKADDGEGNFVPQAVFHDGTSALEMKNRYSILYNQAMQSYVDEELGGDGVLLTRSGYTGTQRFPFAWAGDNRADFSPDDGLPSVVLAGQNAALSGISLWGSDIAGYAGTPTKEVFLRWTQFATFTPLMQVHMTSNLGPWDFGEEALEIFRDYAVLRTRLFPYLYDAVHESARSGLPVIRPMVLAFQDDPEAHRHVDQYLYGPDLLVAPVTDLVTRRAVYLPPGAWIDFWSGRRFEGGRTVEVDAPLARIPLFVRGGALLPLLPADVETLVPRHPAMSPDVVAIDDRRVLQVWPGADGSVETWDGISARIQSGDAGRVTLHLSSRDPRPIAIHLAHRDVGEATSDTGPVRARSVDDGTVLDLERFEGRATVSWRQGGGAGPTAAGSEPGATSSPPRARIPEPAPDASPRARYRIDEGWRFRAGPVEDGARADLDDADWQPVGIPHTWNAEDAFDEAVPYRRGIGWYRTRLSLDPALEGRRIFLHFEGANQAADVWVDGQRVGGHTGGYTAFAFDVTERVAIDRPVVLAVRVDNRHDPDVPPLDADFTFYGGLYRDVWLIATDPVHFDVLDHASPGVFVDAPGVSAERATVRVRGSVVNETDRATDIEVVTRILDREGREATTIRSTAAVPARGTVRFEGLADPIRDVRLWSPADPHLYRVRAELRVDGRTADRVEVPLGLRWARVDPDSGFFLNGAPLSLRGTNRHQDRPGVGNALPDAAHREDLAIVAETGFDFVRLAHYPQDPAVLDAADRLGLVVWEEIPVVNRITLSEAFRENAERMLVEMIRQHYNHPSIVFWGTMNEVLLRPPDPPPEGYVERVVDLARGLDRLAHEEDPTRITAMAISLDEIDDGSGLQNVPDVLGLNLYFGWYYRELDGLGAFLDDFRTRNPDRPLLISEYGAGSDERVHALEPRRFDFSAEYQRRYHESQFPQMDARGYLVGTAVWNQFDFGSKGRHDTKPGLNQKGIHFFDRSPKGIAHYYRARRLDVPVLHLATREWDRRAGSRPGDEVQPVTVYTNLDAVELFVDDVPFGSERVENRTARWSVPFRHGIVRLRVRGTWRGSGEAPVEVEDSVDVRYDDRTRLFARPAPGAPTASTDGTPPTDASRSADPSAAVLAVNAGAHYQFVDADGTVWEADRPYREGSWGFVGGEPARTHHAIAGTDDEPLFQVVRQGAEAYRFDVADGRWDVRVGLVEIEDLAPGERRVGVRVNGTTLAEDLDLAADRGRYAPVELRGRVVAAGESVTVRLESSAGESTIASIHLRRTGSP